MKIGVAILTVFILVGAGLSFLRPGRQAVLPHGLSNSSLKQVLAENLSITEAAGGLEKATKDYELQSSTLGFYFALKDSPYAGAVTQKVACPDPNPNRIELGTGAEKRGFLLLANDRRVIEPCPASETAFRLLQMVMVCPKAAKVFHIKYFEPAKDFKHLREVFEGFNCE